MTQFDHAVLLGVRRSRGFVGDQVVDEQLDRIERLRAAAVQPEREDLADDPVAFRSGGAPRLVAQGQDAFSVVRIELRTRRGRLALLEVIASIRVVSPQGHLASRRLDLNAGPSFPNEGVTMRHLHQPSAHFRDQQLFAAVAD